MSHCYQFQAADWPSQNLSDCCSEHDTALLCTERGELRVQTKSPVVGWSAASLQPQLSNVTPQASLRIFGGSLTFAQLPALFASCPALEQQVLALRLYQPHPDLAPALLLQLPMLLSQHEQQDVRQWAQAQALELVYLEQAPSLSEPGLLLMDMDSTAIEIECIDEIARKAGVGDEVAKVTARAMRGELDFAASLRERVAALKGADATILAEVLAELPLMPGLTELVVQLKGYNWHVAIASGGFTYFTKALEQQLGLSATFANELAIVDGKLTGEVQGAIVDASTKARVLGQLATQYHLAKHQTVAIGDGANDLPMLAEAGLGVAFHAKPLVQAKAKAAIRHGSLLQLLYLLD